MVDNLFLCSVHVCLHLSPDMQYWDISSKTCTHLGAEEQEVFDPVSQTMIVKVFLVSYVLLFNTILLYHNLWYCWLLSIT